MRLREPLPDDTGQHACALAFISDLGVVYSARRPGAARRPMSGASLDHALWLHRPVPANEWLLFPGWPASNSSARGLATGTLHAADGTLAASMTQEAILRPTGESGLADRRCRVSASGRGDAAVDRDDGPGDVPAGA